VLNKRKSERRTEYWNEPEGSAWRLALANTQIEQLRAELIATRESWSWKLTRPLRFVARTFAQIFGQR